MIELIGQASAELRQRAIRDAQAAISAGNNPAGKRDMMARVCMQHIPESTIYEWLSGAEGTAFAVSKSSGVSVPELAGWPAEKLGEAGAIVLDISGLSTPDDDQPATDDRPTTATSGPSA